MARKLRLWQACFLCLLLPLSASVFQCVIMPAVPSFDLASVKVTAVPFNYIVSWSYVFPIFSIALVFYGILHKDRLTAALNVSWHLCWYIFLYLVVFPIAKSILLAGILLAVFLKLHRKNAALPVGSAAFFTGHTVVKSCP